MDPLYALYSPLEGDGEGPDPRPQYPTYPQYRPYLPLPSPDPVLPDPVLELEADPSRSVPQAQPVFSLTDLVLPVQDPQERQLSLSALCRVGNVLRNICSVN